MSFRKPPQVTLPESRDSDQDLSWGSDLQSLLNNLSQSSTSTPRNAPSDTASITSSTYSTPQNTRLSVQMERYTDSMMSGASTRLSRVTPATTSIYSYGSETVRGDDQSVYSYAETIRGEAEGYMPAPRTIVGQVRSDVTAWVQDLPVKNPVPGAESEYWRYSESYNEKIMRSELSLERFDMYNKLKRMVTPMPGHEIFIAAIQHMLDQKKDGSLLGNLGSTLTSKRSYTRAELLERNFPFINLPSLFAFLKSHTMDLGIKEDEMGRLDLDWTALTKNTDTMMTHLYQGELDDARQILVETTTKISDILTVSARLTKSPIDTTWNTNENSPFETYEEALRQQQIFWDCFVLTLRMAKVEGLLFLAYIEYKAGSHLWMFRYLLYAINACPPSVRKLQLGLLQGMMTYGPKEYAGQTVPGGKVVEAMVEKTVSRPGHENLILHILRLDPKAPCGPMFSQGTFDDLGKDREMAGDLRFDEVVKGLQDTARAQLFKYVMLNDTGNMDQLFSSEVDRFMTESGLKDRLLLGTEKPFTEDYTADIFHALCCFRECRPKTDWTSHWIPGSKDGYDFSFFHAEDLISIDTGRPFTRQNYYYHMNAAPYPFRNSIPRFRQRYQVYKMAAPPGESTWEYDFEDNHLNHVTLPVKFKIYADPKSSLGAGAWTKVPDDILSQIRRQYPVCGPGCREYRDPMPLIKALATGGQSPYTNSETPNFFRPCGVCNKPIIPIDTPLMRCILYRSFDMALEYLKQTRRSPDEGHLLHTLAVIDEKYAEYLQGDLKFPNDLEWSIERLIFLGADVNLKEDGSIWRKSPVELIKEKGNKYGLLGLLVCAGMATF